MKKIALVALLALASTSTFAADDYLGEAHNTNRSIVRGKDSSARQFSLKQVQLSNGQSFSQNYTLRAGKTYNFYGDCDTDCSDIDLVLKSSNGSIVAADRLPDDEPLFSFTPNSTGNYTATLTMKSCSTSKCDASIHVFEGRVALYDNFTR